MEEMLLFVLDSLTKNANCESSPDDIPSVLPGDLEYPDPAAIAIANEVSCLYFPFHTRICNSSF